MRNEWKIINERNVVSITEHSKSAVNPDTVRQKRTTRGQTNENAWKC